MARSFALILGGTKGLGRELAIGSLKRGITPVITGRSTAIAMKDPELDGALFSALDLTSADPVTEITRVYHLLNDVGWGMTFSYVFWVAGIFLHKPLTDCMPQAIQRMTAVHFTGPLAVLSCVHRVQKMSRPFAKPPGTPYHLVTIGSTNSWRIREDESVYNALKAAKAHFTRNFAIELFRDLPGSKVTLVNPAGIATPNFWDGTDRDLGTYMDPKILAQEIWMLVTEQETRFEEYQVLRTVTGTPDIRRGPTAPEIP